MHEERAGETQELTLVPVEVVPENRAMDLRRKELPVTIQEAGHASGFAYEEFLFGQIRNPNTRRAYQAAINRFLEWLRQQDLPLVKVAPRDVGDYLDSLKLSIPSKKLHRAALNHFFDFQVQRHAVVLNPVSSVRNERYQVAEGKTPEITVKQARRLFGSIEGSTVVGLRDRAAIAVLACSGPRIGAVARLALCKRIPKPADLFPASAQAGQVGLATAQDSAVWDFARAKGFAIVTLDRS